MAAARGGRMGTRAPRKGDEGVGEVPHATAGRVGSDGAAEPRRWLTGSEQATPTGGDRAATPARIADVQGMHQRALHLALAAMSPAVRAGDVLAASGGDHVVAAKVVLDGRDRARALQAAREHSRRHRNEPVVVLQTAERLVDGRPLVRYSAVVVAREPASSEVEEAPHARRVTQIVLGGATVHAPPPGVRFDPWLFLRR